MTLTIEIPDEIVAALKAKAAEEGLSADSYAERVLKQTLENTSHEDQPGRRPFKQSRGILAHLGPAPSAEDIDEARREVWGNFPRD